MCFLYFYAGLMTVASIATTAMVIATSRVEAAITAWAATILTAYLPIFLLKKHRKKKAMQAHEAELNALEDKMVNAYVKAIKTIEEEKKFLRYKEELQKLCDKERTK